MAVPHHRLLPTDSSHTSHSRGLVASVPEGDCQSRVLEMPLGHRRLPSASKALIRMGDLPLLFLSVTTLPPPPPHTACLVSSGDSEALGDRKLSTGRNLL